MIEKQNFKELCPGLYIKKNQNNGFVALSLYWWAHPERDEKWKKEIVSVIGIENFSREYELDFSQEKGRKVYPNFSEKNIKKLKYIPNLPLLIGWDFGFHHPAVIIGQRPDENRFIVLDELMGTDVLLDDFIKDFFQLLHRKYPDVKKIRYFCDPAGRQKKDTSEKSSIDILRQFKIYPYSRKCSISEGLAIIRRKINEIGEDGYPNLIIDSSCKILIEGFLGGYVFPEKRDGLIGEEPAVDGYYEHLQDCLRYTITGVFKNIPFTKENKRRQWNKLPLDKFKQNLYKTNGV